MPSSEQANSRRINKLNRIIRAWSALTSGNSLANATDEDLHYHRLLESGFKEFSDRFFKQQEILQRGILFQRVSLALSKMQAVRRLRIRDKDNKLPVHSQRGTQVSSDVGSLDDERFLQSLPKWQPMTYAYRVQDDDHYPPGPTFLAPALLAELDTVNFRRLNSLDIEVSTFSCLEGLSAAVTIYSKIQAAMQNLKSFRFIHGGPVFPRSVDEIETLRDFLGSIIVVESLESLSIETNLWNDSDGGIDPALMPSASLVKARTDWPNLSSVLLNTIHIEHSDLTNLLSCVNSARNGYVGLRKIHLMDGSWATILDLLRERHSWANLASPSGAECEAMSMEEYEQIFGPYSPIDNRTQEGGVSSGPKEAESYIRGWQDNNPLNVPPELNQD